MKEKKIRPKDFHLSRLIVSDDTAFAKIGMEFGLFLIAKMGLDAKEFVSTQASDKLNKARFQYLYDDTQDLRQSVELLTSSFRMLSDGKKGKANLG